MDKGKVHRRTLLGPALAALLIAGCTGDTGGTVLASTTAEPAGANCANGGTKLQFGVDSNTNGVLDPGEANAAQTRYVCNGGSNSTLVKTSPELAGANCPFGGVKIETGVDANGNGTLDASEVNASATSYACNGTSGPSASSSGLVIAVTSVTTDPTGPIAVRLTMRDARGFPVDRMGIYTVNTPVSLRFSLSYITQDADGNILPYTVLTNSNSASAKDVFQPTAYNPDKATSSTTITPGQGTIVENGSGTGDYTYTFPPADVAQTNAAGAANGVLYKAVTYDSSRLANTHTIWIQASRQTNLLNTLDPAGFTAVNAEHNYIPNNPSGTPLKREIASTAGCNNCHRGFSAEGLTSNGFHGSGRIDAAYCGVCHNPGRTSNPSALSSVFVHRIHAGESLQPANVFHGITATYPQDIRNCNACHKGAAQGDQAQKRPTLAACTSCHDQVDFAAASSAPVCTHPAAVDADGLAVPCRHNGGTVDDATCTQCHTPSKIDGYHVPIALPDPNNILNGGTNQNTNAAYLAAAGSVPTGAAVITYLISSVDTVADSGAVKRPTIKFKLQKNGADVVFPTFGSGPTELLDGFVGSPSIYFAFSVPQDGVDAPADYNVTASGYVKGIWNGSLKNADGSPVGSLDGPDDSGFYTITLPAVVIPDSATMLTGGVGYTYNLKSAFPLTEIDLPAFPYNPANKQGGLIVPAPDVFKVASTTTTQPNGRSGTQGSMDCTLSHPCVCSAQSPCIVDGVTSGKKGSVSCSANAPCTCTTDAPCSGVTLYTGRHTIVDNSRCLTCHVTLGAAPTFHAGQRNNGPTCSFCHNPNQTTSGWSGNAKDFIHAIHGARKRTTNFMWHATSPTDNFADVEFPGPLNNCTACHVSGDNDFSSATSAAAVPNMLVSTVAKGRFDGRDFTISPYVVKDNVTDYGFGFSTSNVTLSWPDGRQGTQGVTPCTIANPCTCTTDNPCTVIGITTGKQDKTACTPAAPCTCTTAAPCVQPVKPCTTTAPCEADATTLVKTPITAACTACHDTPTAIDHMQAMGGYFYAPRSVVFAPGAAKEQCLLCHGPGKLAAIADVHK